MQSEEACSKALRIRGLGSVCIDSRKAETGSVFFALSGERVDGHDYLEDAVLAGCTALVVSKMDATVLTLAENRGVAVVQVKDTEQALQDFAQYYLSLFSIRKVGVTGSTGKDHDERDAVSHSDRKVSYCEKSWKL